MFGPMWCLRCCKKLFETIEASLEFVHGGSKRDPNEMLEPRRKVFTTFSWIDVEKTTRHADHFGIKGCLKKCHAVSKSRWELPKVNKEIKCSVTRGGLGEPHIAKSLKCKISLCRKRLLNGLRLGLSGRRFEQGKRCTLDQMRGTTVKK